MCIEALNGMADTIAQLEEKLAEREWIPCSDRLPSEEDCPMDCLVTRKSNFIGNYVDMAVAEANGTWTHEDWDAIVLGDVESGRKTGLISTRDDGIIAWMPLPEPHKGSEEEPGQWQTEDGRKTKAEYSVYCSKCGSWSEYRTKYCGNCGSLMKEENDE